jgi:hypothetical protein
VNRVVVETAPRSGFIEEFRRLTSGRVRHTRFHHCILRWLMTGIGQNFPKTQPIAHYQGKRAR